MWRRDVMNIVELNKNELASINGGLLNPAQIGNLVGTVVAVTMATFFVMGRTAKRFSLDQGPLKNDVTKLFEVGMAAVVVVSGAVGSVLGAIVGDMFDGKKEGTK